MSTTAKRIIALLFLASVTFAYHEFFHSLSVLAEINKNVSVKLLPEKESLYGTFSLFYLAVVHTITLIYTLINFTKANNKYEAHAIAIGESHDPTKP